MTTKGDLQEMRKMMYDVTAEAIEDVIFPKFEKLEGDMDELKTEVGGLKTDVSGLKTNVSGLKFDVSELKDNVSNLTSAVEILDNDMTGVKMRLGDVEKKLDTILDTSLVVRDHHKRISKLEAAIA